MVQTGGGTRRAVRFNVAFVTVHAFGLGATIAFFAATSTDAPGPVVLAFGLLTALYLLMTSETLR